MKILGENSVILGTHHLIPIEDAVRATTTFAYDANGRIQTVTDSAGRTTHFYVNSQNDLECVENPDDTIEDFTYTQEHLMTSHQDRRGMTTDFQYDAYRNK